MNPRLRLSAGSRRGSPFVQVAVPSALGLLLLWTAPVAAQSPTTAPPQRQIASDVERCAAALVRHLAPAADDPDHIVRDLLDTAGQCAGSPLAEAALAAAVRRSSEVQDPAALRQQVAAAQARGGWHGLAALRLRELAWVFTTAVDGPAAPDAWPGPYPDHAREWLCVGPFGDDGDDTVGVVFGPELEFPLPDAELAGRTGPVRARVVQRKPSSRLVDFADPRHTAPGTYYGMVRFAVAADCTGHLELECRGSWQLFVDGTEVARAEPWRRAVPTRTYVPVRLPAGEHFAVLKTADNDLHTAGLRWLDALGQPLAGCTELPAGRATPPATRATAEGPAFATALQLLAEAAQQADAPPAVRLAALYQALRHNEGELALQFAQELEAAPPTEAAERLALAVAIADVDLPDELKTARARALAEGAVDRLLPQHHHARMAKARLLEQQDRREDALRLLADHPAPGPATFERRLALLRRLSFDAEIEPLLLAWRQACPRDPQPLDALAERAERAGQVRLGLEHRRAAAALHAGSGRYGGLLRRLADLGELAAARELLDRDAPRPLDASRPPTQARLQHELHLAWRARDAAAARTVVAALLAHGETDARIANYTALVCLQLELPDLAVLSWRHSLSLDPDQPRVERALAAHGGCATPGADFGMFQHDGTALRNSFTATDRDSTAPSTLLLDQRIVEVAQSGSVLVEVHQLHRINDQSGVDAFRTLSTSSEDDEVLLVRSVTSDGIESVPPKVEGEYAMARLAPGTFVELRYRTRVDAPGPEPLQIDRHLFRSDDAPLARSELVLILPPKHRGELRGRDLPAADHEVTLSGERTATVFTVTDQDRLPQERFTLATGALVPFAEFGEDAAPFGHLRRMRHAFWWRSKPLAPVRELAERLFAGKTDPAARLAAANEYVQRELEAGQGDSATEALLRKKGDRFLALAALLQAGDLEVAPFACRDHRPEFDDGDPVVFASGDTLDTLGMRVQLPGGPVFVFSDTPRHWPLGAVPANRSGSTALVLHDERTELVALPVGSVATNTTFGRGTATVVGNDLQLQLELEVGDVMGYGLAEQLRQQKQDVQKLAARQIAAQALSGWRVQQAELTSEPTGPFRLRVRARRSAGQRDGEHLLLPLPLPPGKLVAGLGDRGERKLPFHLPADVYTEFTIRVEPGDAFEFAAVPEPVHVSLGGLRVDLQFHADGRAMVVRRSVQVQPTALAPRDFGDWLRALGRADRLDQLTLRCRPVAR